MTEYISREDYCETACGKENREGYKTCHNCSMLNVPSADVQPERCRQLAEWLTELKKAKSMLLDSSYTLDIMCNKLSGTIGCEKCTYYNPETHDCEVRAYISKARAFVKGDEAQ